ncbi:hypothetical protein [Legionella cardiaca]|uniref:Transmembrane protein n=1 Tax=Legionella cardiaca TaxID=1071983 RepID=A0ABY8AUG6_9GAMM|nr:hypothetical protein [Legionella cardiaca]WED42792.1 hypothetical protein PXX05_12945 [Legionella cardiaca]
MGFIHFLRKHWAASLAILLAVITTAAVVTAVALFPPSILAIAGFSVFGATPFAALATLSIPAATAVIGAMTFVTSLAVSALFNAVVSAYNFMNKVFTPKEDFSFKAVEEDSEESLEDEGPESTPLMQKLFGCCFKKEKEKEEEVLVDTAHHKGPLTSEVKETVVIAPESTLNLGSTL